jgi:transposase
MGISLTKKVLKGHIYYYARECKRVDGKPKIVWQKYLGRAEKIVEVMTGETREKTPAPVKEVTISDFGAVAALLGVAERLGLVDLINANVSKREQGLSVGHYMLIAALNRCVAPCSKQKLGEWFESTPLLRLTPARKSQLTSKRFWDNMGHVSQETINAVENALATRVVEEFGVDPHCLLFDATNFFTYIHSFNERSTLPQRGHSKEKRGDLRIVGLALLVSVDFHIPLFHDTYMGNRNDAKEFGSVTDRLMQRYHALNDSVEQLTIVFDKGNNSKDNIENIESIGYHFVGSLKLNQCPELLTVPVDQFEPLLHPRLSGVRVLRAEKLVFGKLRTVVVAYNEQLYLAQASSLHLEIRKRTRNLENLSRSLGKWRDGVRRGGRKPTVETTRKKIAELLKGQYVKDVVSFEVKEVDGIPAFSYRVDQKALHRITIEKLGKTVLFTDNEHWSSEEIVLAYRGQAGVESAFRTMKNPHFVSWSPMFHWTDDKIRVHAFYCVLALMLTSLLRRELHLAGIDISIPEMLKELGSIREVAFLKEGSGKEQTASVALSKLSTLQAQMMDRLGLRRLLAAKS